MLKKKEIQRQRRDSKLEYQRRRRQIVKELININHDKNISLRQKNIERQSRSRLRKKNQSI